MPKEYADDHLLGETITSTNIEGELKQSYIDYAMTVIVSRALPDTRDGLKPVLRRILYAMYDMKIFHNTSYKKSARIVGEVLGKYHPHGDTSVYEAMVRLAQDRSLRYPLVDGQGNFGSIDGDSPAQMRYTEARMTKLAQEMLEDIRLETVDRRDNFDGSLQEPVMLSTKFPNHLCNGTMGIAVGMATNMPPHNLNEVVDACLMLLEKEGKPLTDEQKNRQQAVILIDAVHTLFHKDEETGELSLNKALADDLARRDQRIIVVTNAPKDNLRPLLSDYSFELFTREFDPEKTKPEYWTQLLDHYDLDPKQLVYVDHSQDNLDAAKEADITNVGLYQDIEHTHTYLDQTLPTIQQTMPDTYRASIDEIMDIIQGPDFPTGGMIFDPEQIKEVYKTGRGKIVMRGKTHVEDDPKHGQIIIINELPYQVNKATLVQKIGDLVNDKKLPDIEDVRDESSRDEIKIALYLKKGAKPAKTLVLLYKLTYLQSNFNVNNVTLVEKGIQPKTLNIKDLLMEFVDFRRSVVYRRSVFLLQKAKHRLHILEGLDKAIGIIDEVIETIKQAQTKEDAKEQLMAKFDFSQDQAEYILLMRLQSLVGLEIQKVRDEIEEKKQEIAYLEGIINDQVKLDAVVADELIYIKDTYGDERKTEVVDDPEAYKMGASLKDLLDKADRIKEDCIFLVDNNFECKVLYQSRIQNIPDNTLDLVYTHNQDKLVVITSKGELVVERLKDLGNHKTSGSGLDLKAHFHLKGDILFAKTLRVKYDYICMLSSDNNIKKIDKDLVLGFKKFPTTIMKLPKKGEHILSVLPVQKGDNIGVVSQQGQGLLFPEDEVRTMGKTSGGITAIKLKDTDKVAGAFVYQDEPFILVYTKDKGKMISIEDIRIRKRARAGDPIATGVLSDPLLGGMSIDEGAVSFTCKDKSQKTIHSDDIKLGMPDDSVAKLGVRNIIRAFRPWEEKEENIKYKEEQKKKEENQKKGLFE